MHFVCLFVWGVWLTGKLQYAVCFKSKGHCIFAGQQSPQARFLRKYFSLPLHSVHMTITLPRDAAPPGRGFYKALSFLRLDLSKLGTENSLVYQGDVG